MMNNNLISEDYLMHHGVKGMKWGVRNDKRTELRNNYKRAKNEYSKAKRTRDWSFGRAKRDMAGRTAGNAAVKVMNADVAYSVGKAKSKEAASKAEFKAYTRGIRRAGITGSINDQAYGKQSTKVYNEIKKKKGKAYADRVESRAEKQLYATIIGGMAVMVGGQIVSYYLYE